MNGERGIKEAEKQLWVRIRRRKRSRGRRRRNEWGRKMKEKDEK